MNPKRCNEYDYINFLVAAQKSYSCLEASRVQPLHTMNPDNDALWQEAEPMVKKDKGLLVLDDSTLDKPYAQKIPLVYRHGSGKHHDVVKGINLLTLLWTDGDKHVPCDHRLYDLANGIPSKHIFICTCPSRLPRKR